MKSGFNPVNVNPQSGQTGFVDPGLSSRTGFGNPVSSFFLSSPTVFLSSSFFFLCSVCPKTKSK